MRWVTFTEPAGAAQRVGVLIEDEVRALHPGTTLVDAFGASPDEFRHNGERATASGDVFPADGVRLEAPVPRPPSMRDFLTFEEHLRNALKSNGGVVDPDWYELPVFYFSNPAAVLGPTDPVPVSSGSRAFDYELELAAVVGWEGEHVHPDAADDLIAGYTLYIDWSARDLQMREMALRLGPAKGKDSATTLGPVLVTPDELGDRREGKGFALAACATVNGRRYTDSSFAAMHWSFAELIAYASRSTRVVPGDVIGSGTCGKGCTLELQSLHGPEQFPWLQDGDVVEFDVDVLGTMRTTVVAGPAPHPLRAG